MFLGKLPGDNLKESLPILLPVSDNQFSSQKMDVEIFS